ncbi:MAG: biotin synthase BioB [Thermoguttaceae bacterium]|nr:biotin synthase BioB [Thermoguttaceae bacterium]
MTDFKTICNQVLAGEKITRQEAIDLHAVPTEPLCRKANEIRQHFCSNSFDLCTIINGKSGKCSENCRFCAQSAFHHTNISEYPLLPADEIVAQAKINDGLGILRYSIVTSGKRLSDREVDQMCETIRKIRKETNISVCVSFGLLNEEQFRKLKNAGVARVHNNLETSRRFFPEICTTHTYEEKINTLRAARKAGLSLCSGGIMGIGETQEDRIDLAFTLRELGVQSVPVNMFNPVPGTPLEHLPKLTVEQMRRIVAIYRFILPDAAVRLAGGRGLLPDKGRSCFTSGANAAISGDMLTTAGIMIETDKALVRDLGYEVKPDHE